MVSISLREPDLSKCRVSNIVKADIRLNKAPHISIEKYIVWMLSIHFAPSAMMSLDNGQMSLIKQRSKGKE